MQPRILNLEGWSNAPLRRQTIQITSGGSPLNLTGHTARMQVRTPGGMLVLDLTGPSADGIQFTNAAAGEIVLHVGWTDMLAAWNAGVLKPGADADLIYDLLLTDGAGLTQARLEGRFRVRPGVTLPGGAALYAPPFGEEAGDYGALIPTTLEPVVALRTPSNALVVRSLSDTGIVEEFVEIDPAGAAGVAGGYQGVSHRAFVGGRLFPWLLQPHNPENRTTEEAAIRIHDAAFPYSSDGESQNGAFGGYGHGRWRNTPANNQITMVGGPAGNLQSMDNWPPGTIIRGTALVIVCPFRQVFFGTETEAVSISLLTIFDRQGKATGLTMQALRSDVRWQDSYALMIAATASAQVTHGKLAGYPAIPLIGDGQQKGNWHTATAAPVMQFYGEDDPTIICEASVIYGPPMRKNDVDLNWTLNKYGRVHLTDGAAFMGEAPYGKFRVLLNSSEEAEPRTSTVMSPTDVFSTLTRRRTVIRPGGAL